MEHRQVRLLKDSKPPAEPPEGAGPWIENELKHLWALANKVFGRTQAVERLYDILAVQYHKAKLHELDRASFLALLNDLRSQAAEDLDTIFEGTPMAMSWQRIRWLQRRLKWPDGRLVSYILWHGRKTGKQVDSIRWLTVQKARGVMVGMQHILDKGTGGDV